MTNLFPLPCWAPALKRVPIPLQVLNEAFVHGIQFAPGALDEAPRARPRAELCSLCRSPLPNGEDAGRFAPG